MHQTTYKTMMTIVKFLWFHRVATLSQLSKLLELAPHDLRRKLERFPDITCTTHVMTLYQDGQWHKLSRVNVYALSKGVVAEYERRGKIPFYLNKPYKDPRPETDALNRFVLLTELALRSYWLDDSDVHWAPAVAFEDYVMGDADESKTTHLPILAGLFWVDDVKMHYYGVGLFMNSIGGFTSYIKRAFPIQYDHLYKSVVFVPAELMKEAITICQRHALHVILHNYEWSVDNTQILRYGIKRQWDVILKAYVEQYQWKNCTVTYAPEGHGDLGFRWEVRSDNQVVEYFDTTVARTIREIQIMATQRKAKGTVFVTTLAEKEAWTAVSKTAYARVKYQVIDWPIR